MRTDTGYSKMFGKIILFTALVVIGFTVGCDRDRGLGNTTNLTTTLPTAPTVLFTIPADGTTSVPLNTKITATFSEAMTASTVSGSSFTLTGPGAASVTGTVTYDALSHSGLFAPTSNLAASTTYTGTITIGAKNLANNALANNFVWTFTTGTTINSTAPLLITTDPANAATGVPVNQVITATFNVPMDPTTITWTVTAPGPVTILGIATYAGNVATFTPFGLLQSTTYTVTIAGKDLAGNAWTSGTVPNPWTFTTGTTIHLGPAPVVLGSASTFRILAGSTITNTGVTTSVNGDVGVFPGTAITGLLAGNVTGTIYPGGPIAGTAKVDLLAAYSDAQSRSTSAISLPGNLGGLTLVPGLYVNASSSGISGVGPLGILTLDAQGDPNAVWIFKMGSTLITDPNTSVVITNIGTGTLANLASHVYWQVGSSATLGTNSVFYGTILSDVSITMTTNATLHGRALTRSGAVTLDTNTLAP